MLVAFPSISAVAVAAELAYRRGGGELADASFPLADNDEAGRDTASVAGPSNYGGGTYPPRRRQDTSRCSDKATLRTQSLEAWLELFEDGRDYLLEFANRPDPWPTASRR